MTAKVSDLVVLPEWLSQMQEPANVIERTVRTAAITGRFYNSVMEGFFKETLGDLNKQWVNATLFLPALGLVFSIPKFINDTYAAATSEETIDKVYRSVQSALGFASIVQATTSILAGLKEFGKVAKETLPWAPVVSLALFPLNLLSIDTSITNIYQGVKTKKELDKEAPKSKKTDSLETRVANITKSCEYVIKNKRKLAKSLDISEEVGISKRAKGVLANLKTANQDDLLRAVEEGEAMMKTLRCRANTKVGLGAASAAIKTAAFVTASTLLIAAPTPVAPFVLMALATLSVASWALDKMVLNGNPFAQPKDVWSEKIPHHIRTSVENIVKETRKLNKKFVQYVHNFQRNMEKEFEQTGRKIRQAIAL